MLRIFYHGAWQPSSCSSPLRDFEKGSVRRIGGGVSRWGEEEGGGRYLEREGEGGMCYGTRRVAHIQKRVLPSTHVSASLALPKSSEGALSRHERVCAADLCSQLREARRMEWVERELSKGALLSPRFGANA